MMTGNLQSLELWGN